MTSYAPAERLDLIRRGEAADRPVKRTLEERAVPRSPFYRGYERYLRDSRTENLGRSRSGTGYPTPSVSRG